MARPVKIFSWVMGVILLLLIIFFVVLALIASHMNWRALLISQVKKQTGRELQIQGKLAWHVFPQVVLVAHDIRLSNPPSFAPGQFAAVKTLDVSVATWPLLRGEIQVKRLTIDGADIRLVRDQQGRVNWTMRAKTPAPVVDVKVANQPTLASPAKPPAPATLPQLFIPALVIENARLRYEDQQSGQALDIQSFSLQAKNVRPGQPFPLSLSFVLQNKQPKLTASVKLDTTILWAEDHINLSPLVMDMTLEGDGIPRGRLQEHVRTHVHITPAAIVTDKGTVLLNGLKMQHVHTKIVQAKDNVLLKAFSLDVAHGRLQGVAALDRQKNRLSMTLKTSQLSIQPILAAIYGYQRFHGVLNGQTTLQCTGGDLHTLNGDGTVDIQNGQYQGIDFAYLYRVAMNTIKPGTLGSLPDSKATRLGHIQLPFTIRQGVLSTQNLLATSPVLRIQGAGQANLVTKTLQGRLLVTGMQGSGANPRPIGPEIPFLLGGTFDQVRVQPDLKRLLRDNLQDQVQDQLQKHLKKLNLGKLF